VVCRNPFAKTWRHSNSFSAAAEIQKSYADNLYPDAETLAYPSIT